MLRANNSKENGFVVPTSRFSFQDRRGGRLRLRPVLRFLTAMLLILATGLGCVACAEDRQETDTLSYDGIAAKDWIRLAAYTDLTVVLTDADTSRSEAIWQAILEAAEVISYPQEQVRYYVRQEQAAYRHDAEQNDMRYEDALAAHDVSEESILADARALVKSDLVYRYIVTDAAIALTEAEKDTHYDRYADRLAEQYGYRRSYIDAHLQESVYEAMLYDKTMEYLMLHNHFSVAE